MLAETDQFQDRLPVLAAWTGFGLGVLLTAWRIYDEWCQRRITCILSCSLTSDCFFRLIDGGETAFLNIVLCPQDRPAFVTDIRATLTRLGTTRKQFQLHLLRYGQPADRGKTIHDHFFFSSSPLDIINPGFATRRVLMMSIDEYRADIVQLTNQFYSKAIELALAARIAVTQSDTGKQEELMNSIRAAAEGFAGQYIDKVQVEAGQYEINMAITYRDVEGHGSKRLRVCNTKLAFDLEAGVRDMAHKRLKAFGEDFIRQMSGTEVTPVSPEIVPQVTKTVDSSDVERS